MAGHFLSLKNGTPHRSGFDDPRRVVIPTNPQPTVRTIVPPLMQLFGHLTTAPRAPLTAAAGIPCNRQQPSSFSLGCQNLQELTPTGVMDRFGQPCPCQTFDVQCLMGYVSPFLQKLMSNFVVEIPALVGYFLMCLAQPLDRFLVAV